MTVPGSLRGQVNLISSKITICVVCGNVRWEKQSTLTHRDINVDEGKEGLSHRP